MAFNTPNSKLDKAIGLLNDLQLASDKTRKQELLSDLSEVIFHQEPALLRQLFGSILDLQTDKLVVVRKFILNAIDTFIRTTSEVTNAIISTLGYFLQDDNAATKKTVIISATNAFRKGLSKIASSKDPDSMHLWHDLQKLKRDILNCLGSENATVQAQAVKFIESLVIAFSTPDMRDAKETFNLHHIPSGHPVLSVGVLRQESESFINLLIDKLGEFSSTAAIIVINSLAAILKVRPVYSFLIIPAVQRFAKVDRPDLSESQLNSLQYALKTALVTFCKIPSAGEYREAICDSLCYINAKDQADILRRQFSLENTKKTKLENPSLPSSKRLKHELDESKRLQFPPLQNAIVSDTLMNVLLLKIASFEFPSNFVYGQYVSDQKFQQIIGQAPAPVQSARLDPRRDPRLARMQDRPTPAVIPFIPFNEPEPQLVQSEEPTKPKIRKGPPKLLDSLVLPEAERKFLSSQAFIRIISAENWVKRSGGADLRVSIIARLALHQDLHQEPILRLYEHLQSNFVERYHLALSWLFSEYINETKCKSEKTNKEGMELDGEEKLLSRYTTIFLELISRIKDRVEQKNATMLFINLFVEAPCIPGEVLDAIRDICNEKERVHMGLSTLHKLIIKRPPTRERCLEIVLNLSVDEDEDLRKMSIGLVANKLFSERFLQVAIENFAGEQLQSILSSDTQKSNGETNLAEEKAAEEKTEEEPPEDPMVIDQPKEASTNVQEEHSTKETNGELEHVEKGREKTEKKSFSVHALVSSQTRAFFENALNSLLAESIQSVGVNQKLLNVLINVPAGAENLVKNMIQWLTENETPSIMLVSAVKEIYAKTKDITFFLPILHGLPKDDIVSHLPELVKLDSAILKPSISKLLTSNQSISPKDLLVELHKVDADMKKIVDAIAICLEHKNLYTDQTLAVVLQQLIVESQLPPLFMRTVIQAITLYPKMSSKAVDILQQLLSKQVWNEKVLWHGFIHCCKMTEQYGSLGIIMRLPKAQLEDVLSKEPDMREKLKEYCSKHSRNFTRENLAVVRQSVESEV